MTGYSRPLVLAAVLCLITSQLLLGCSSQSTAQKRQEQQKAFKGGPAPPEVMARIRAMQKSNPKGPVSGGSPAPTAAPPSSQPK